MKELLISQFVLGITLSWGPCLASCGVILLPYITGTKTYWWQGLESVLYFSLGRLLSYTLLGGLVGLSSKLIARFIAHNLFQYFEFASGIIILFFGLALLLPVGKLKLFDNWCKLLHQKNEYPLFVLGIIIGFSPCAPLIGNLLYLVLKCNNIGDGFLYGFVFGIGTLVSPLFLLGLGGSIFSQWSLNREKLHWWLQKISGAILILFSLNLFF